MNAYAKAYQRSIEDPEGYWRDAAALVDWVSPPQQILDDSRAPLYRWFVGGQLNTCFNAVDRHVASGRGSQPAIIYESPVTNTSEVITYSELLDRVSRFAGALANAGVTKGDRVLIYLPMVPESVIAMLACARIGAVHSVVFGGFAPAELAARIDDAQPKVIVAASCGIEGRKIIHYKPLLDTAVDLAEHKPNWTIMLERPQAMVELGEREIDWNWAVAHADPVPCVTVAATDPLYILYTSGTTGKPKGVVRDNGGHAVALTWSMKNVYDIEAGDVWWAASDVGWVVGHSYIVYAPLFAGATTIVYEGKPIGTPDPGAFWHTIAKHRVKAMFCAPTAIRAIRKEDPNGEYIEAYNLKRFQALFQAGERLDPETYAWATEHLGVPVIDNWWQTETGWAIASNLRGLEPMPIKPGSPTKPTPGYRVVIVDENNNELPAGTEGNICIDLPLPPGCLPTLWGDDERFVEGYLTTFPGRYATGDGGYLDDDGYVFVLGRTDDVINVAGHRLSTGVMEAVVARHPAVAECAVIGIADKIKGQVPKAFVVLKAGAIIESGSLHDQIVKMVRAEIGPVAALQDVVVVPALPKTRSGKILRRSMRAIADGRHEAVPSTIDDPNVLEVLRPLLTGHDPMAEAGAALLKDDPYAESIQDELDLSDLGTGWPL